MQLQLSTCYVNLAAATAGVFAAATFVFQLRTAPLQLLFVAATWTFVHGTWTARRLRLTHNCVRVEYEHMFENLTHNKIVNLLCKPSARAKEMPGQIFGRPKSPFNITIQPTT